MTLAGALLAAALAWAPSPVTAQSLTLETRYGDAPANADRVLVTTGDGRWQELQGSGGTYHAELGVDRYMLAVVCFETTGPNVTIYRFPVAELPLVRHTCVGNPDLFTPHVQLRGQVAIGAPARSALGAQVSVGDRGLFTGFVRDRGTFQANLPAGRTYDVVALRTPAGSAPDRAVIIRDLQLDADSDRLLDLGGSGSTSLERYELTVDDPTSVTLSARLATCNGTYAALAGFAQAGTPSVTFAALPPESREACDRYELSALQLEGGGTDFRAAFAFDATPTDTALELPALPAPPAVETVGVDPLRARLSWRANPDATVYVGVLTDEAVTWSFVQSASVAPAITLPPWGADLGVRDLRGGSFRWGFGYLESNAPAPETLHAWQQSEWFARGGFTGAAADGLQLRLSFVGGEWIPHPSEPTSGP